MKRVEETVAKALLAEPGESANQLLEARGRLLPASKTAQLLVDGETK